MAIRVIDPSQSRQLTVEEWVQHPDGDQYELIDSVLRARIVNESQHEFAVVWLATVLLGQFDLEPVAAIALASRAKYRVRARRGIMPDLSVILDDKVAEIRPEATYNSVGPDLAVEMLLSEQDADYIEERLDGYGKLGTSEVWSVEPETETLTGYARASQGYEVFAQAQGEEEFTSRLLPGLTFLVARLWMRTRMRS